MGRARCFKPKALACFLLLLSLLPAGGARSQQFVDDALALHDALRSLAGSSSEEVTVDVVSGFYERLAEISFDSTTAIDSVVTQIDLQLRRVDAMRLQAQSSSSVGIRETTKNLENVISELTRVRPYFLQAQTDLRSFLQSLDKSSSLAVNLAAVGLLQEAGELMERDFGNLSLMLEQIELTGLDELGIVVPSLLDCLGPGCPLAS